MPFEGYDREMRKMLNETYTENGWELRKYPEAKKVKLEKVFKDIVEILSEGNRKGYVGEDDLVVTIPAEVRLVRAYGQPKDHKEIIPETGIPPLRPVISCLGSIMEGSGKLGDDLLRPVDEAAASYIQDTTALLRRVQRENERGPQPKGMFVFSLDVIAMYPSIPTSRARSG